MYHLLVTVILQSDLVFRRLFPKQISNIFEGRNPKFGVWVPLWIAEYNIPFSGHIDLDI